MTIYLTPPAATAMLALLSIIPSIPITCHLLHFDRLIAKQSLPAAAGNLLRRYYAGYRVEGEKGDPESSSGGRLLIANHAGLGDALALLQWWGEKDILIVTRNRDLFEVLPALRKHIIPVGINPEETKAFLNSISMQLAAGRDILLFPAGRIEDDPWLPFTCMEDSGQWPGLIGYLIEQARRIPFDFTIQPVLVGNVYGPLSGFLLRFLKTILSVDNCREQLRIRAYFTFLLRTARKQSIILSPLKPTPVSEIPPNIKGKKSITSLFSALLREIEPSASNAAG